MKDGKEKVQMKRLPILIGLMGLAALLFLITLLPHPTGRVATHNQTAPTFVLTQPDGGTLDLAAEFAANKVTLLNFWSHG